MKCSSLAFLKCQAAIIFNSRCYPALPSNMNGLTQEQLLYKQSALSNMTGCSRNIIFIIFSGQPGVGNEPVTRDNRSYQGYQSDLFAGEGFGLTRLL